jgi:alpha-1,6-mannosyltransferase
VPLSAAVAAAPPAGTHLRLVSPPRLRVADVALFYGERSGGIRTYLDAKVAWARRSGAIDHHLGAIERARLRPPDVRAAHEIAEAHRWDRAFEAELADLERLLAA